MLLIEKNTRPKKFTSALCEKQPRQEGNMLFMHVTGCMSGMLIQLCKTRIGHYEILAYNSHQNFTLEC